MQRSRFTSLLGAALLLGSLTVVAAPRAHAQLPPQSNAYGKSLAQWFKTYVGWYFQGGPDTIGNVRMMPFPNGVYESGSFTPDDPGVLVGSMDVTLKAGSPFVLPITFWYGESYAPGTPVAVNPDPVLPQSLYELGEYRITIDGKTIIDSAREGALKYYSAPQYFTPPVLYPEPTSYGSISMDFAQGYAFVHQPLSKGVHTMTLESRFIIPGGGFYANLPDGNGVHFKNSWTITVK